MAGTVRNRSRRSARSTQSRRRKIVGGLNWKLFFATLVLVAAPIASGNGRLLSSREIEQIKIADETTKAELSQALGVNILGLYTNAGIMVDPHDIQKVKDLLKDKGLDEDVKVTAEGLVRPRNSFDVRKRLHKLIDILKEVS